MASADRAGPRALALKRLAESGLTAKNAGEFGIEFLSRSATAALSGSFQPVAALRLNYHRPSGVATGFYRVRYLETLNGFDALTTKRLRYAQPPKTAPEAYWPKSTGWPRLAGDPAIAVFLTEGELKACCAVLHGLPTIAIGGVWSWRSANRGEAVMPSLVPAGFIWKDRIVYVVFDNDVLVNPDVSAARLALCDALTGLGARPTLVDIPDGDDGKKVGLDDYLLAHGRDAFDELAANAPPFASARALWQLNDEAVYVRDPGLVVVMNDGRRMAPQAFVGHAFANRHYHVQVTNTKTNAVKLERRSLAKAWVEWEGRAELARMTYAPGEARVTARDEYNLWRGWGCAPVKGDVGPWHALLAFLFKSDPPAREWFERWCAYPLQHPGTKLYSAAVVWGVVHGTGKSLVGYSLGRIYGRNFTEIGEKHLYAPFNEWAESKQFVLADDITSGERRGQNTLIIETLKNLITQQSMRINAKFVPSFEVPDCINYYFTGNQPDLVFLEDTDRRYFIHEVVGAPMPRDFYKAYDRWLESPAGMGALFHHLLNLPLGDFDPKGPAPWTSAKREMAHDNKSDLASWVSRLRETPDDLLKLGGAAIEGDLFTTQELLAVYDPERRGRVTANGLGRELKRAGFRKVNGGAVIITTRGPQRLYAVRNAAAWADVRPKAAATAYNARFMPAPEKKAKF